MLAYGPDIALLFTDIPEVLAEYGRIHNWALIFPLVAGFGLTFYGIFTGSNTTRPIRNSTFMATVLFLTAVFVLVGPLGNTGLWIAFILFYVGRAAFLIPYSGRIMRKI